MNNKPSSNHFSQIYSDYYMGKENEKFYIDSLKRTEEHVGYIFNNNELNNKRCLDAGSGCGLNSFSIANLGAKKVVGVDMAKDGIATARYYKDKLQIKNVEFRQDDITNLSFEDDFFDVVFCWGVICHTNDPIKALYELIRVLKPDGTLFISFYKYNWQTPFHDFIRRVLSKIPEKSQAILSKMLAIILFPFFLKKTSGRAANSVSQYIQDWFFAPYRFHYKAEQILEEFVNMNVVPKDYLPNNGSRYEFSTQFYIKGVKENPLMSLKWGRLKENTDLELKI